MGDDLVDRSGLYLHSTWSGIVLSVLGALIMVGFSALVIAVNGVNWFTVLMVAVALALVAIVLFDLPIASRFTAEGVTRRNLLRHHELRWDEIDRLRRHRVGIVRTRRDSRGGGLIAKVGRRSYTLVDKMESANEFDELLQILGSTRAEALGLTADKRPPAEHPPTWLYRRSHWRPESAR